jgi:peptide/nickel transport system ATP-binding protein
MKTLEVRDLCVEFDLRHGVTRALDRVSLDIDPGEAVGFVGESGAGKSLTGLAVLGLVPAPGRIVAGEIRLSGERIDGLDDLAMQDIRGRRIGAVFQDPLSALDPMFTVGDQLVETMQHHLRLPRRVARERAVHWLERVGIPAASQRVHDYPHQFSGGMRQRVVIALALCAEPELVIADEPTTALDVSVQAQVLDMLRRLCREQQVAMLLVSHDLGVIAQATDRVVVLYAGRIAEVGATRDVIRCPKHPYTQGLVQAIPRLHERRRRLMQIPGAMPPAGQRSAGCAFAPRCSICLPICETVQPRLEGSDEHRAACVRTETSHAID